MLSFLIAFSAQAATFNADEWLDRMETDRQTVVSSEGCTLPIGDQTKKCLMAVTRRTDIDRLDGYLITAETCRGTIADGCLKGQRLLAQVTLPLTVDGTESWGKAKIKYRDWQVAEVGLSAKSPGILVDKGYAAVSRTTGRGWLQNPDAEGTWDADGNTQTPMAAEPEEDGFFDAEWVQETTITVVSAAGGVAATGVGAAVVKEAALGTFVGCVISEVLQELIKYPIPPFVPPENGPKY